MQYSISFSCISHIGKVRSMNQDNFICDGRCMEVNEADIEFSLKGVKSVNDSVLFGIFDGMGGEECGEIAAYIAAKRASAITPSKNGVLDLRDYCKLANDEICEYAQANSVSAMGTTAAMLLFTKREITLCNIGDSKIFRFSSGELEQISEDHVAISAFGTKPPLSQNLGIPPTELLIEPYLSQGKYKNGDKYLICSDGLTDMVSLNEIKEMLSADCIENASRSLVERALENGGKDNTTVILLEVKQIKNSLFNIFDRKTGGVKL